MPDDDPIKKQLELVFAAACRMGGITDYEVGNTKLSSFIASGLITPKLLFFLANGRVPQTPDEEAIVAQFPEILRTITTLDELRASLKELSLASEERVVKDLGAIVANRLPELGENLVSIGNKRPHRKGGGRPTTIPSDAVCQAVCEEILRLHGNGMKLVAAQKRVSERSITLFKLQKSLKLRTVQAIWSKRAKYLKNQADPLK